MMILKRDKNSEYIEEIFPPANTNTLAIPNDQALKIAYEVYKPSRQTRELLSEKERHIYAEAFVEHINLGTLSDLCVRQLAKFYGLRQHFALIDLINKEPLKARIFYDTLSVDLPLAECYHIDDEKYWQRVVLAKCRNTSLANAHKWKNIGISLKFVELIEECPAEYLPEEEIENLCRRVKDFISDLRIRHLQSLKKSSFEEYLGSVAPDDSDSNVKSSITSSEMELKIMENASLTEVAAALRMGIHAEMDYLQQIKEETRRLRILEAKAEKLFAESKITQAVSNAKKPRRKPQPFNKKKHDQTPQKSIFDLKIIDENQSDNDDEIARILDKRNLQKLLFRKKHFKYPMEHCHHIDLAFLRLLDNLRSFSIEFDGPLTTRNYHERHVKFSYRDMENLAYGLSNLHCLKIFRLRNSLMDAKKLNILIKTLKNLEQLEVLDFGYDHLQDDIGDTIKELLNNTKSIKRLELEGNFVRNSVLKALSLAIVEYEGKLMYLGLAHNPLDHDGLHALVQAMVKTKQLQQLQLNSTHLNEESIKCCIANELLHQHNELQHLNLNANHMSVESGNELVKALSYNKTIRCLECRDCDLDFETERDIAVLLKRNQFIAENPYIGDNTKTEQDIYEWHLRVKNPLLLKVYKNIDEHFNCQYQSSIATEAARQALIAKHKMEKSVMSISSSEEHLRGSSSQSLPFATDPNDYDEEQIKHFVLFRDMRLSLLPLKRATIP